VELGQVYPMLDIGFKILYFILETNILS